MPSPYFLFVVCLFFAIAVKGQDGLDYCANPIIESDAIVDVKFIHDNYKTGWNTQFGNAVFAKNTIKLLQGTDTPDESGDTASMCFRTSFDFLDEHHLFGYHSGMGGLTAEWNCTDSNHTYDCNIYSAKNNYKFSAKKHVVYFDRNKGHNSVGAAFCYSDGTVGWYVNSISKELSDEETKIILDRFKAVGFNPDARIPLRSENCP